jgi:hypothetical protein
MTAQLPNIVRQGLRYGMLGVPSMAAVQSVATACGSCSGGAIGAGALLALLAGAALFVATGSKKKGK